MNRNDFQTLANLRVKEAKILLDNGCSPGAYYLVGYAIECALKACIAKKTNRFDFPPDPGKSREIYTHNLENLLKASELDIEHSNAVDTNPQFAVSWAVVKDWSEQVRYASDISEAQAHSLYTAVTARRNGVLPWLKKWW